METFPPVQCMNCHTCGAYSFVVSDIGDDKLSIRCVTCRAHFMSPMLQTGTAAIGWLKWAIAADAGYRQGWQANIACAMMDELSSIEGDVSYVHTVANNAAHRFLCTLVGGPLPHWAEHYEVISMKPVPVSRREVQLTPGQMFYLEIPEEPQMSWGLARRVIFDLVGPVFNLIDQLVNGPEQSTLPGDVKHDMVKEAALDMLAPVLPGNVNADELNGMIDAGIRHSVRMKNASGEFQHRHMANPLPADAPPHDRVPPTPGLQTTPSGEHGGGLTHESDV